MPATIIEVLPNSIAEDIGIEAGDRLLSINENPVSDILQYQFMIQESFLLLAIEKASGALWEIEIEKEDDEGLGLVFEGIVFDRMKVCRNRCIFCFVDQLPAHMRKPLYIKDDDYRYSFCYGNYITLTNLDESDWEKICSMRISPLYVSVHSMNPEIRAKMLSNPEGARIKEHLQRLCKAGIQIHTQIVLCPDINDGPVLQESIKELARLYPAVQSIGIVPVGLTGHRERLFSLRPFTDTEALELVKMAERYQEEYRKKYDISLLYLADEFYIKSGLDFPPAQFYDNYCQIENGIGMSRMLLDDFALLEPELPQRIKHQEFHIISGVCAEPVLKMISGRLNLIEGLDIHLLPVANQFFGGDVTVTGLLTGNDIIAALGEKYKGKQIIIPEVLLKAGEHVLLDGVTVEDIQRQSGAFITIVDGSAASLLKLILSQ